MSSKAENPEDGWIEHTGRSCPVAPDAHVAIRLRHRKGDDWLRGGTEEAGWFERLGWWDGSTTNWRITAYRLVQP